MDETFSRAKKLKKGAQVNNKLRLIEFIRYCRYVPPHDRFARVAKFLIFQELQ